MENKTRSNTGMQQTITEGLQMITDMSMTAVKTSIENSQKNMDQLRKLASNMGVGTFNLPFLNKDTSNCCPPKQECPPHCLMQLSRNAYPGERIVIPFAVRNKCNTPKRYRVGVRELKNIEGTPAPSQPMLNKNEVTLEPGQTEVILMTIDLGQFSAGNTYNAEIVIREKEINQNICFSLNVEGYTNVPVATPLDEKKYSLHWQSWQTHFYCEPKKR